MPSHSSSQPLQSHSLFSNSILLLSFHFISSFQSIPNSSMTFHFHSISGTLPYTLHRSLSFHPSSLFHPTHTIHLISSLPIFVSQLLDQYHVCSDSRYHMFICCVDRKHSLSIDVFAFASDDWFESSSIEWWGNERMGTCGLEGVSVVEAVRIEVDSIRC